MDRALHTIGWLALAIGILLLMGGIVVTMVSGSAAGPICLFSSIVVNTVAITLLRRKR